MKRAQGFSCFFAPPVLLQAVPAGKEPYQHHLPIKRRHTSPSSACWKSPKANMGTGNDWGQPWCSGFLLDIFPLSSRHPLQQMSHTPHGQQGRVGFFPRERTEPQKEDGSCLPKETEFLHRQFWGKNLPYAWSWHQAKLTKMCWKRKMSTKTCKMDRELFLWAIQKPREKPSTWRSMRACCTTQCSRLHI